MVLRALAFALALLLLWPGLLPGAGEAAAASVTPAEAAFSHEPARGGAPVDDLPTPAQVESVSDLPVLPAEGAQPPCGGLAMARPRPLNAAGHPSPDLAGPQRPPCTIPLAL